MEKKKVTNSNVKKKSTKKKVTKTTGTRKSTNSRKKNVKVVKRLHLKTSVILILTILLALIVLMGSSYAWYTFSNTSNDNVIKTGEFDISLSEGENTITLENAYPQTDESGLKNTKYTFSVSNNGSIAGKYAVYLDDLELTSGVNRISDNVIKYVLTKNNNSNGILTLNNVTNSTENGLKKRILAEGTLEPGESVNYSLVVWIDENSTSDIEGKQLLTNLSLSAEQLHNTVNEPVLGGNLIPVVYDGTNWVKASYTNLSSWYNYDNKLWANAVNISTSEKYNEYKNSSTGSIINLEDVNGFFVWIPRFRYKIFDTSTSSKTGSEKEIQILFESKSKDLATGKDINQYLTHKAFTSFNANGMWVGKFETTGTNSNITVKPNEVSLRSLSINTMYNLAYNYSRELDSHMMKNTEWGAVSYLSHSKYGKNSEVLNNTNSSFTTGGGDYITNISQSTTGNITGIYDMSGGSGEYVMANYNNLVGSSEIDFNSIDSKYYDSYATGENKLGDAVYETLGWYGDFEEVYDNEENPWFVRGGSHPSGRSAGVFALYMRSGSADGWYSFRLVLTK